ncbi:unnamed protein product [Mycena citricolor]|uniref:Uncharacterized protein n=1 Tax=Mycena citricolor TaxID=2018698 RepID=A0AAD2JXP8_9AGAR|nr:unnamed protein product [Mycena citricolor]
MSRELPLKVRVDIRDQWDSSKSSVNGSVAALTKVLGHTITPQIDWPILWTSVKERYSDDNTTFVPTVVRYAIAWYERLSDRLDNDVYADWTESLLNILSEHTQLALRIQPGEKGMNRPTTRWEPNLSAFLLYFPTTTTAQSSSHSSLDSGFDRDFENLLNADAPKDEEWAEVVVGKTVPAEAVPTPAGAVHGGSVPAAYTVQPAASVSRLPVVDALARPRELFATASPHNLIVEERNGSIVVQGSHEPSLELLASYLSKWGKSNPNDSTKRPILKAELRESEFCFGVMDTLVIERPMTFGRQSSGGPLNPVLVYAFVEGVLGYRMVDISAGQRSYVSTTLLR